MEVRGLPTEKIIELRSLQRQKNDRMKDKRCSKTSLDYLPLTLRNSLFSKSDDKSTNVRRNCENSLLLEG